jgi:hypothetical protein
MTNEEVREAISSKCDEIKDVLLAKNTAYGNSALDPIRIFSQCDALEQIKVRIDDKLSRVKRGQAAGEDIKFDLVGYLILLIVGEQIIDKSIQEYLDNKEKPAKLTKEDVIEILQNMAGYSYRDVAEALIEKIGPECFGGSDYP